MTGAASSCCAVPSTMAASTTCPSPVARGAHDAGEQADRQVHGTPAHVARPNTRRRHWRLARLGPSTTARPTARCRCPSFPLHARAGPLCPQPVMRPYTRRGLRSRQTSGPRPRRSITPGRMPSISASADARPVAAPFSAFGRLEIDGDRTLARLAMSLPPTSTAARGVGIDAVDHHPRPRPGSASSMPQTSRRADARDFQYPDAGERPLLVRRHRWSR